MPALLLSLLFLFQAAAPSRVEGTIKGRIVARDGKPEANIRVMAIEAEERPGNPIVTLASSDADGVYRLENVPPGRYIIAVGFVDRPSYYPGVAARSDARIVSVLAGATVENIDFANLTSFKVQGRITVLDKEQLRAGRGTKVRLMQENGQAQFTEIGADGGFEFSHVSPGHYGAMVNPGVSMVPVHVEVAGRDITDLELVVPTTKKISGRIVVEGEGRAPPGFQFSYDASNPVVARNNTFASVNLRDQSFQITLPVGRLGTVIPTAPAGNFSIKAFTYGNLNLLKEPLIISASDNAELRVVLGMK
jgi:hypothetical protein